MSYRIVISQQKLQLTSCQTFLSLNIDFQFYMLLLYGVVIMEFSSIEFIEDITHKSSIKFFSQNIGGIHKETPIPKNNFR